MKIVVATDKFKGSLSSMEAGEAIKLGLMKGFESYKEKDLSAPVEIVNVPIADGGDGSAEVVSHFYNSKEIKVKVHDPLGRRIESGYSLYEVQRHGERIFCAFIEMAKVSGLALLSASERDPLKTSTYGLGELISDALQRGVKEISVSIGGSATNDGGIGMLQALGFSFYNASGEQIKREKIISGEDLPEIAVIRGESVNFSSVQVKVICDVTNPLYGSNGATMVYGPQKGAGREALCSLESGMKSYAAVAREWVDKRRGVRDGRPDSAQMSGAGAAGGVGFALRLFLGAELIGGKEFFSKLTGVEEKIAGSDLVISGEGRLDNQSFCGKVVDGIVTLAGKHKKPVALFCGLSEISSLADENFSAGIPIYTLKSMEPDLNKSMSNAYGLLKKLAEVSAGELIEHVRKVQAL